MEKLAIFGGTKAVKSKVMLEPGQPSYGRDYPIIGEEEIEAVTEVLNSRRLCSLVGTRVTEFEQKFAEYIGTKYAFATNTGTAGLQCAVAAAGIRPGDEVIVPAYTFIASATCVSYNQGVPVFVDVDPRTYNLDPEKTKEAITPRTKAIMVVHLYGQPADMDAFREIASDYKLTLIEDAAQAHGATFKDKKVGSLGDIAVFSFQESKNMQTGEGGMVTTNNKELALRSSRLRLFGEVIVKDKPRDYVSYDLGYNFRMTEIEAAIGLVQLRRLDGMNEARIRNAKTLDSGLRRISRSFVTPPFVDPRVKHVYHMYAPKFSEEPEDFNREILIEALRAEGVPVFAWQQMPLQNQPVFKQIVPKDYMEKVKTPVAEVLCKSVLHMYIHPPNGDELMNEYLEAFKKVFENVGELGGMATAVKLRAPKDWGVPREA